MFRKLKLDFRKEQDKPVFRKYSTFSNYNDQRKTSDICDAKKAEIIRKQKDANIYAYCSFCGKKKKMNIDFIYSWESHGKRIPNFRERLRCSGCGLNSRLRATIHMIDEVMSLNNQSRIYITEEATPFFDILKVKYPGLIGSEYLSDKVLGKTIDSKESGKLIHNEDLRKLSFSNGEFDLILSLDVLEHIYDYQIALKEICRILKIGGSFVLSVPFELDSQLHKVRAKTKNGEIVHSLPKEMHGDPTSKDGCLCFYHFGWDLLKDLKRCGFNTAEAYIYQSIDYGYIIEGIMIHAIK